MSDDKMKIFFSFLFLTKCVILRKQFNVTLKKNLKKIVRKLESLKLISTIYNVTIKKCYKPETVCNEIVK